MATTSTFNLNFSGLVDQSTGRAAFIPELSITVPGPVSLVEDIAPWDEPPSPLPPSPPPKGNPPTSGSFGRSLKSMTRSPFKPPPSQASSSSVNLSIPSRKGKERPRSPANDYGHFDPNASSTTLVSASSLWSQRENIDRYGGSTTSFGVLKNGHGSRPSESDTSSYHESNIDYNGSIYGSSSQYGSELSAQHLPSQGLSPGAEGPHSLRKSKSSMFSNLMRKRSKGRLRTESDAHSRDVEHPSLIPTPPPLPESLVSLHPSKPSSPVQASFNFGGKKEKGKKKSSTTPAPSIHTSSSNGTFMNGPLSAAPGLMGDDGAPLPPSKDLVLDTDFGDMAGIVDQRRLPAPHNSSVHSFDGPQIMNSPAYGDRGHNRTYSSDQSFSSASLGGGGSLAPSLNGTSLPPIPPSDFKNPFSTANGNSKSDVVYNPIKPRTSSIAGSKQLRDAGMVNGNGEYSGDRRVSPKTMVGPNGQPIVVRTGVNGGTPSVLREEDDEAHPTGGPGSPSWMPPESWEVYTQHGASTTAGEDYPSSEDDNLAHTATGGGRPMEFRRDNSDVDPSEASFPIIPRRPASEKRANSVVSGSTESSGERKKSGSLNLLRVRKRSKNPSPIDGLIKAPPPTAAQKYRIRIYRSNEAYHITDVGFKVTVASLTPKLKEKFILGRDHEVYRLYLMEKGRERLLAPTERPADIVRRRLEQAGYDVTDGWELLADDGLSFLVTFVFRSTLHGPEEDVKVDASGNVTLEKRSLSTIPLRLYRHADSIRSLTLSRNPLLEIPLDFIQSCTSLHDLRLSSMALKKVPHSVKNSTSLRRLDISCNRIADLDDAFLDQIPSLRHLYAQNNRMEKVPWYFPRLRNLAILNISNNKFRDFPLFVCQMVNIRDLDMSFNMIQELPDEIGQLVNLERLIIVGNRVSRFPETAQKLVNLRYLDCRRNTISDVSVVCTLPSLESLSMDHNAVHASELALGPKLQKLDAAHNEFTKLSFAAGDSITYAVTVLDISNARLSLIDDLALTQLPLLQSLKLDHNKLHNIPETLGDLQFLETLSCTGNALRALPTSIGRLQRLKVLNAHSNNLTDLPSTLWNCSSLHTINVTSNLLASWHHPPVTGSISSIPSSDPRPERKTSLSSLKGQVPASGGRVPPLVLSLERLYLGENGFTDEVIHPLAAFRELRVLNLSFNDLQDLPLDFFKNFSKLEELYLSGNKLTTIPTEDLQKLVKLNTIFLNGNRLQTLPQELGKVISLTVLDVGSNLLKYNINNWEFDWNWNFNKQLRYLNLSGNKRLQIKSDTTKYQTQRFSRDYAARKDSLAGFTDLGQLRVLGLMDVTITTNGKNASIDIPDETYDRRVRTSLSTVARMSYGIADMLGQNEHLRMLDLVHEFPNKQEEAVFAMFGRAQPYPAGAGSSANQITKFIHDRFIRTLETQLRALNPERNEMVPDALRRTFLKLNQELHTALFGTSYRKMSQGTGFPRDSLLAQSGASGVVLYFVGRRLYVANAGNALAVISRGGNATLMSQKHDPYERSETMRIRAAEGWVSPLGLVNDEVDISRSFGFFHLMPMVNARPHICVWELSELDEFVIVANRGLWDYMSYQTAVDIARRELGDPMIAAQKLRDLAMSYGADGSTMVMVIGVADLFKNENARARQGTLDPIVDPQTYNHKRLPRRPGAGQIDDRMISRLPFEVPPPTGHIAIVFTDIVNSTHLWEVNPGTSTAMRIHNALLRRQLRFCGGYEVKTEGDAFMCSFRNTISALWWCMSVQLQLLEEDWPLEILECTDGKPVLDTAGRLVARGLAVKMGIHCGEPLCEPDPVTARMDYFGPMVNRSARIQGSAKGGQIMCSADAIREINAKLNLGDDEVDPDAPLEAIDAIRRMGIAIKNVGEVRLKGLEVPEVLSMVFPSALEGRATLQDIPEDPNSSGSRVPFSVNQMSELGLLCLRLEALATGRLFKILPPLDRKGSVVDDAADLPEGMDNPNLLFGDPSLLLPSMNEKTSDNDLMLIMDSLAGRIENAIAGLYGRQSDQDVKDTLGRALLQRSGLDSQTLNVILDVLKNL